jgi:protein-S-isoprenylcysteine O-methyltransferase Ste14
MTENARHIVFTVVFLCFAVLWLFNYLRVGIRGNTVYTSTEGALVGAVRYALQLASVVAMLVYVVDPRRMEWGQVALPDFALLAGAILAVPALALFGWVLYALGRNFSMTLTIKDAQTLVTNGPYQFVRHPMYTSFLLLWLVFFLLTGNWFIGATGIGSFVLVMLLRTPREERMMLERFGDEYVSYMKRTGRYLPTFGGG